MKITVFTTYLIRYEGKCHRSGWNVIQKYQNRWETNYRNFTLNMYKKALINDVFTLFIGAFL